MGPPVWLAVARAGRCAVLCGAAAAVPAVASRAPPTSAAEAPTVPACRASLIMFVSFHYGW
ncbi:hypothetical protein FSY75_29340 [Streptomyces sp. TR1341]|nr:hypothetical protein [Streptomyces sp. TR1341]